MLIKYCLISACIAFMAFHGDTFIFAGSLNIATCKLQCYELSGTNSSSLLSKLFSVSVSVGFRCNSQQVNSWFALLLKEANNETSGKLTIEHGLFESFVYHPKWCASFHSGTNIMCSTLSKWHVHTYQFSFCALINFSKSLNVWQQTSTSQPQKSIWITENSDAFTQLKWIAVNWLCLLCECSDASVLVKQKALQIWLFDIATVRWRD